MPKTVGAESIRSVSLSPTEEEEFYDYEFCFSVFAKTEFFYTFKTPIRQEDGADQNPLESIRR